MEQKSIIVITWDGKTKPLSYTLMDTSPNFELFLYDYSGTVQKPAIDPITPTHYLSKKSECKGDLMHNIYSYLQTIDTSNYKYIGLLDDDIYISISDLNKLLFIANVEQLDVFQASLTLDSYYNHRQFIYKPGHQIQKTWWVEIMAPFYSMEIFMTAGQYFQKSISGTGLDVYVIPTIQRLIQKNNTAVVHAVQMKHCRPIRTGDRIFSNAKDNLTEIAELQQLCKDLIKENPAPFDEDFINAVINRKYIFGIPLKYKIQRIPLLLKNLYGLIVDASYR